MYAALRRLNQEMGIVCPLEPLFTFDYRAPVSDELTENELVHVFGGSHDGRIAPDVAHFHRCATRLKESQRGLTIGDAFHREEQHLLHRWRRQHHGAGVDGPAGRADVLADDGTLNVDGGQPGDGRVVADDDHHRRFGGSHGELRG
jgi:hypothetical protein